MSVTASFRFGFEGMSPGQILYGAVLLDERQDPSVCGKQMRRDRRAVLWKLVLQERSSGEICFIPR